jgi:hypothetical protein
MELAGPSRSAIINLVVAALDEAHQLGRQGPALRDQD